MRRVLVCGGVDFDNKELFYEKMKQLVKLDDIIVSGHAKGADTFAEEYAKDFNMKTRIFPAEWKKYGRAAGPIRNKQMLDFVKENNPVVIAFWNGKSRGTKNTVETARKIGIEPIIISY